MKATATLTAIVLLLGLLTAQPIQAQPPADGPPAAGLATPPEVVIQESAPAPPRFYGSAEYLLWWIKDGPLPVPLVTAGSINDPNPAAMGQPNTHVLFGNQDLDFGSFSGGRLTLGAWLNRPATLGFEATWFQLENRAAGFQITQSRTIPNDASLPAIGIPFGVNGLGELVSLTNFPLDFAPSAGGIAIRAGSHLWGLEGNGVINLERSSQGYLDLLVGYRHLSLDEAISIREVNNFGPVGGGGRFLPNQRIQDTLDVFQTNNEFMGGQLGLRLGREYDRFSVLGLAKLGLGTSRMVSEQDGSFYRLTSGPLFGFPRVSSVVTRPGGLFGRPTYRAHEQFAVVPELQAQIAYRLGENLRLFAGYTFLYWSRVVRPGEEINHVISTGNTSTGFVQSPPLFNTTDFLAHGVSFGAEWSW